jgi:Asp-tRNA(Asn)/Glu-tRNA(Gln) amidotransferase A subunit family amidase
MVESTSFLSPIEQIQIALQDNSVTMKELVLQFFSKQSDSEDVKAWVQKIEPDPLLRQLDSSFEVPVERENRILSGLFLGIKDNIATKEFPTKMGTSFWVGTNGGFDARVVAKLRNAGAIIAGKTRCSEFAVHKTTGTLNPRYLSYEPGTSSSGSAAAVANGEIAVALGTQTAGSISKPASYCGIIGFKPSFGDIPRTGILKTTELFDTVGFLGRRVSDIEAVYRTARVDGNNHPIHVVNRKKFRGLNFSSLYLFSGEEIDNLHPVLQENLESMCREIASTAKIPFMTLQRDGFSRLRSAFYSVYYRDLAYFIRDHFIEDEISEELHEILEYGIGVDGSEYSSAREAIESWRKYVSSLPGNPLFISASTSEPAPLIGKKDNVDANLFITSAGLPQISLPMLRGSDGRLVGLSLSSKRFSDDSLITVAKSIFPDDALQVPS